MGYKDRVIVGKVTNKYISSFYEGGGFHKHARLVDQETGEVFVGTVRNHMDAYPIGSVVEVHCKAVNSYKQDGVSYFRKVKSIKFIN